MRPAIFHEEATRSRRSTVIAFILLLIALVVWAVILTRPAWVTSPLPESRGVASAEQLQQAADVAEQALQFDVASLVVGAAAGFVLVRVCRESRRRGWVVAAAVTWVLGMGASGVGLVTHLFVVCLPTLYWLGLLSDFQVAG